MIIFTYLSTEHNNFQFKQTPNADKMGQRDAFSSMDIEKINKMYLCHKP
jgi:hypothetical protein